MYDIAQNIIHKFGGHRELADALGLDVSRVYRFTYEKERGGTDGLIPAPHQQTIIEKARELGKDITYSDFFPTPTTKPTYKKINNE